MTKLLLPIFTLILMGCEIINSKNFSPADQVKASEVLIIAETYRSHKWDANTANRFHGHDSNGVLVHTPDITLPYSIAKRSGWWMVDKTNIGIPYKWGGFDTPFSFDQRIANGAYAGDVYTDNKRAQLYNGVSKEAAGVDCSGFVSRCWRLSRHYSTRELPTLCTQLSSFYTLQPGDILNIYNVHAMIFEQYTDQTKSHVIVYDTGSAPVWKIQRKRIPTALLQDWGFLPYRYKNLKQDLVHN